jgi:hypothetical protein
MKPGSPKWKSRLKIGIAMKLQGETAIVPNDRNAGEGCVSFYEER